MKYKIDYKVFGSCDICNKKYSFTNRTCNKCFQILIGRKKYEKINLKKRYTSIFLDNNELISVSKIINNYLSENYNKVPKDILKNAAIRGQWVHKVNELYLQNINKENIINNLLKKLKYLTNEINYNYCKKSLIFLQEKFKENNYEFIIKKSFGYDWIAGRLDLIYFDKQKDKYFIVDYKTYSQLDKFKLERIKLQLTTYYWLVLKNGYQKLSNIAYIYLINKNEEKIIENFEI